MNRAEQDHVTSSETKLQGRARPGRPAFEQSEVYRQGPTRLTATATDASAIIRNKRLRSGPGFSDVLVVDHDAKLTR